MNVATETILPPDIARPGDPVPWFQAWIGEKRRFDFSSIAGRYVLMCFFGSSENPEALAALRLVDRHRALFDGERLMFFGVTIDPSERERNPIAWQRGLFPVWDFDMAVSRAYRAVRGNAVPPARGVVYEPFWLLLDPMLRVIATEPLARGQALFRRIETLPPVALHAGPAVHAPVLLIPRVFEPAFCQQLIDLHRAHGGEDSGFMREVDGKTVRVLDYKFKRRDDYTIEDDALRAAARERFFRRVVPEIKKAFQYTATRMERYIVARYDGQSQGHFRAHRDDTTKGTEHRRFAVSINLNTEEYDGGELVFPEFGPKTYRPPTGGAVVFSCSLLHEVQPVTRGERFAFLPFLYDDAAARIREANNTYLGEGVKPYGRAK